ncbi:MAG: YbaB/EbfC family nucleoid-associated protein [Dehalococcoidales bacterium]|nr:YbaB/EbfC family nucleoid-associated protein [Dehalococcoidales bacterium]
MNFEQIKQAQQLKSKLDRAQKELKRMQIEGEAGKGAVTVVVNGEQRIISVKIASEVVDPNNVKKLEQLVVNAVNDAQEKAQKAAAQELKEVTGGLKIPGLF